MDSNEPRRDPLLAAICHDLRAPLAAVTMGANFVLQTTPEDEASGRSRRVLQAILRSCKQMERLVRDFADLSEIESDAVFLRLGVHDAGEIAEVVAEAARAAAAVRNVDIVVVRPGEAAFVRGDRERIQRALAHLVDNAARFAPDGSTVDVAVTDDERSGDVSFAVTDRGAGISEETFAHLYDRTWHAKRTERVGAGLGLSIVRGFAVAHGGRVDVEPAPGKTTVTLALPKDARPSNPPASSP